MKLETFTDIDAFAESNAQIDGRFLPSGETGSFWRSETLRVGECVMQRAFTISGLIAEGVGSADGYSFYMPLVGGSLITSGVDMTDDAISVNEPGAEFRTSIASEAVWHLLFVPKRLIEVECGLGRDYRPYRYRITRQRRLADWVRGVFHRVISAVSANPMVEGTPAMTMLESDLKSALTPLVELANIRATSADSGKVGQHPSKHDILWSAQAYIDEREGHPIHVSELAAQANVSERTLRNVFNAFYRTGPCTYLFLRQLQNVHEELLKSSPDATTVTNTLTKWGIWEFGRFAGRYKRHYGEHPHQTLHRAVI